MADIAWLLQVKYDKESHLRYRNTFEWFVITVQSDRDGFCRLQCTLLFGWLWRPSRHRTSVGVDRTGAFDLNVRRRHEDPCRTFQ